MPSAEVLTCAQEIVGHQFNDIDLLKMALTHSSVAKTRQDSNERLEFLGDSVLGMVVCNDLFQRFPRWQEGDLTKVKSVVVSRRICAKVSDEIGLTSLVQLGNGLDIRYNTPLSVKAAVLESIIGAVYIDGGFEVVKCFIEKILASHIDRCAKSETHDNFKSVLQQFAQRYLFVTPQYLNLDEQGPDHSKCFEVCVKIGNERYPSAWGTSKKEAEQEAAKRALEVVQHRQEIGRDTVSLDTDTDTDTDTDADTDTDTNTDIEADENTTSDSDIDLG